MGKIPGGMITATEHNLPFFELSDQQFEQLCLALLEAEGHTGVRHWGAAGNEGGCDLVSTGEDGRRWVTQAKRTQQFGPKPAVAELVKVLDDPPDPEPQVYLLAATCTLSRQTEQTLNQKIADRRKSWEVVCWGRTELDAKVRARHKVLRRFFGTPPAAAKPIALPIATSTLPATDGGATSGIALPTAKIFISHSTKSDEARQYLAAVSKALHSDPRFEVLLDQECLHGGDDWRERIYSWMDRAHGAVLLLSEEALESSFVPIELAVLSFRHCREQKFPLIPVLVGDVQPEGTRQGVIGDIDLSRIQFVRGLSSAEAAQEVVTAFRCFFRRHQPRTAREILESQASRHLVKAGLEEIDLAEVAEILSDWPVEERGSRGADAFSHFARNLLRVDFVIACEALSELARRWPDAAGELSKLLELVSPFWIEESEAAAIAELALQKGGPRLLTLDVEESWTVRSFICRACLRRLSTRWICEVEPPDDESEHGLASLRRQIIEHLSQKPDSSPISTKRKPAFTERLVRRSLENNERKGKPLFVVLNRDWTVDEELLERFRNEFPTPTMLVVGTSDDLVFLGDTCRDLPGPGRDREEQAYMTYFFAEQNLSLESSG